MVMRRGEGGFTLIEIVLTMAISGAMLVIVFAGQRQIRERAQFKDSIEQTVGTLSYAKNAAFTTVNTSGSGSSGDYMIGKVLKFAKCNSSTATLSDLKYTPQNYNARQPDVLSLANTQTITIPTQVCYDGSTDYMWVMFVRQPNTGKQQVYCKADTGDYVLDYNTLTNPNALPTCAALPFKTISGSQRATISIDASDGAITRTYQ